MDLPCEIIKDLLPLYAEEMASHATAQVVEKHLAHCRSCSTELQAMKKQVPVPQYDLNPHPSRFEKEKMLNRCIGDCNPGGHFTVRFFLSLFAAIPPKYRRLISSCRIFRSGCNHHISRRHHFLQSHAVCRY